MLLVDHGEAELRELRVALHERVRADDEQRLARLHARGRGATLRRRCATGDEQHGHAERRKQALEGARVLLGEQLRGRHERGLVAVLHREQHREERDDGLAAPDVALQQPVHAAIAHHVLHDLARHVHLGVRELVGQHSL